MPVRDVLKLIYKVGMIAVTVILSVLAYAAYRSATPGTGDVLLSWVLGVLAFLALLSIPKLDWQDEQADTYRGMLDEARRRFSFNVQFTSAGKPHMSNQHGSIVEDPESAVNVHFDEPIVHRVDGNLVDEAKRMSAAGAPIDDICRMIDPDHDRHDPMHQEAFRRVVQAMVAEG